MLAFRGRYGGVSAGNVGVAGGANPSRKSSWLRDRRRARGQFGGCSRVEHPSVLVGNAGVRRLLWSRRGLPLPRLSPLRAPCLPHSTPFSTPFRALRAPLLTPLRAGLGDWRCCRASTAAQWF
jgi:hypothetical protein